MCLLNAQNLFKVIWINFLWKIITLFQDLLSIIFKKYENLTSCNQIDKLEVYMLEPNINTHWFLIEHIQTFKECFIGF